MSPEKLSAPLLEALPGVAHAFFTRRGGASSGIYASLNGGPGSGDAAAAVRENREHMRRCLGAEHLISLHQHHSADVITVDDALPTPAPKADAMVTRNPGLALAVLSADCGPLLFADPEAGVIGAAHAGWGGALKGVAEAVIDAMLALGAARHRIICALGPTLAQPSYEVGPEFVERFLADDAGNRRFFRSSGDAGRPHFDLPAYIAARLAAAGISADRFTDLGRDTYAEAALFFSYRRSRHRGEDDYGRLVSAIMLRRD